MKLILYSTLSDLKIEPMVNKKTIFLFSIKVNQEQIIKQNRYDYNKT